ncbi:MAG: hypothetical protein MPEBLZ_01792 [Candidatus Methanoperedens nitroreducens]|uniref:Uncharacterized protein n=1 Tax=Candidatus Methanoperedens nitratireducens TaxID=1392998 RepID=A0A0P8AGS9_9EURY|nr:MAG: hypothetical protein MPEBLZ_01792 [Candidatus Methanoperedens sp. BLZ1]
MNTELKPLKTFAQSERESLMKQFHDVAAHPPQTDPFSHAGAQAWQEWTESCRAYENLLFSMGVPL